MNIPPGFWDNSQCEALSAMKCGRKKPDFAEYQEIRADKFHQEENNNGKKTMMPIFSLTPKASGSTRLQSCEVHEDRKKAIKAGMNAHIAKPISADIILENLERMR